MVYRLTEKKIGIKPDQNGFTLTELMLAMVLFSAVLVFTTVGFIGMNRTYNRGLIKKQLSEVVQRVSEDVSRSIRSQPSNIEPVVCLASDVDCVIPSGAESWQDLNLNIMQFSSVCYVWPSQGGFFRQVGSCKPDLSKAERLMSDRYVVREPLSLRPIRVDTTNGGRLYGLKGTFSTTNIDAIKNESGVWRCRGTSEHPEVVNCAVEAFSIIINPQRSTN